MVKVRSLESVPFLIGFAIYYVYGTFGPSLLIESIDSMIRERTVQQLMVLYETPPFQTSSMGGGGLVES